MFLFRSSLDRSGHANLANDPVKAAAGKVFRFHRLGGDGARPRWQQPLVSTHFLIEYTGVAGYRLR